MQTIHISFRIYCSFSSNQFNHAILISGNLIFHWPLHSEALPQLLLGARFSLHRPILIKLLEHLLNIPGWIGTCNYIGVDHSYALQYYFIDPFILSNILLLYVIKQLMSKLIFFVQTNNIIIDNIIILNQTKSKIIVERDSNVYVLTWAYFFWQLWFAPLFVENFCDSFKVLHKSRNITLASIMSSRFCDRKILITEQEFHRKCTHNQTYMESVVIFNSVIFILK